MAAYFRSIIQQCENPVFLVAQIIGLIPVVLGFFVFSDRSRKSSIALKAFADLSAAIHFALLAQWTGFGVCLVNTARGICFAQRQQKQWASGMYMPVLFCILTVIASSLGWTGPESILPMIGSCFVVIGFWSMDTQWLRLCNLAGITLWLIYSLITFSVPTAINNAVYIFSIIRTQWRLNRNDRTAS